MRQTLPKLRRFHWLLIALTLACASKAKAPEPVPAESFCQEFAKTACLWQQRCSPTSRPEECERHYGVSCDKQLTFRVLRDMQYGYYSYDPQLAATWLNSLGQLPCDSDEIMAAPEPLFRRLVKEKGIFD